MKLRPHLVLIVPLLAVGAVGFARHGAGAAPAAAGKAEANQRVTAALVRFLRGKVHSPNGHLKLVVRPSARAAQGYFSEIYLAGRPAQVKQMRINSLALRARNVRVDVPLLLAGRDLRTISSATSLRAEVTESDLGHLLAQGSSTRSMHLRVKYIGGDKMRVSGQWNWSWFHGPIVGIGRLRLASGYKVDVDVLSLKLNGAEVPAWLKNKFSERLNPVLDYRDIPFSPHFRGVQVQGSKAILFA